MIFNTGTISSPDLTTDVDTNTTEHPVNAVPGIDLVKTTDDPGNVLDPALAGQVITHSNVVTNTGNVTLDSLVLTDDQEGAITLGATTLTAGASTSGTASHIVTQAKIKAGTLANIATVTGNGDGTPVSDTDTHLETSL